MYFHKAICTSYKGGRKIEHVTQAEVVKGKFIDQSYFTENYSPKSLYLLLMNVKSYDLPAIIDITSKFDPYDEKLPEKIHIDSYDINGVFWEVILM